MPAPTSATPPPRGIKKTILLLVFAFLLIGVVFFLGMVGYYSWQIKFGRGAELAAQFSEQFSSIPGAGRSQKQALTAQAAEAFVRPLNPVRGEAESPVTIIAFIDFECPFCQASFPTFATVMERYAPVTRVVFKHFPIESIHPNSMQAGLAAACAQEQGKFWEYYSLVFTEKRLDAESLVSYAKTLSLDENQFRTCLSTERFRALVEQDFEDGAQLGVAGTPTYFVNGKKVEGNVGIDVWNTVLLEALNTSS